MAISEIQDERAFIEREQELVERERARVDRIRYGREHLGRHRWLLFIPLLVIVAWLLDMLIMGQ